MFKKQILKNLLSTLLFGAIYSLISFIDKGYVEPDMILRTMVFYFIIICLLYFVAPKLRRIAGHDKNDSL